MDRDTQTPPKTKENTEIEQKGRAFTVIYLVQCKYMFKNAGNKLFHRFETILTCFLFSPPALHMPVSYLAGSGHQGHLGPHSWKPHFKHYRQHIHLCLCSS